MNGLRREDREQTELNSLNDELPLLIGINRFSSSDLETCNRMVLHWASVEPSKR